jgi:hypothetical protein
MLYIYNIKLTFCHDLSYFWQKKSIWHTNCVSKSSRTFYRLHKATGIELNYQGIGANDKLITYDKSQEC